MTSTMPQYRMFLDDQGHPRATFVEPPAGYGLLGLWLQMDVGRNSAWCQELIDATEAVLASAQERYEASGNLFALTLNRQSASVENLYNEEDVVEIPAAELLVILNDWKILIDQPVSADD